MSPAHPLAALSQPQGPGPAAALVRVLALFALLYLFVLSITMLSASFRLLGREFTEAIFQATSDPLFGLMIGVLATALIQSSSTTTSLIVGLVGSGVIGLDAAIPMVMGANVGTSVTSTIVSLGHITRKDEFRRAFAASIVHDCFNICAVLALMPLQMSFNLIGRSARFVEGFFADFTGLEFASPLAAITRPVADWIIALTGDSAILSILLAGAFLFIALRYIVKVLQSMVLARVERFFQRYVFGHPLLGFLLGIFLTVLVQSSSITTSLVVPLIGAGVLNLVQVYPYMLGANLGTTITAFLASFVTGSHEAVSVAFAHLVFNGYGVLIFWPLRRIPISMAQLMATATLRSRLVPIVYIVVVFFLVPGLIIFFKR